MKRYHHDACLKNVINNLLDLNQPIMLFKVFFFRKLMHYYYDKSQKDLSKSKLKYVNNNFNEN